MDSGGVILQQARDLSEAPDLELVTLAVVSL